MKKHLICLTTLFSLILSGCSGDSWFGEEETLNIEGERISILQKTSSLETQNSNEEIVLPRPMDNTSWPQSGGFANNAMLHLKGNDSLSVFWKADIGKGGNKKDKLIASPVISDSKVYTIDREGLIKSFSLEDGKEIWDFKIRPTHSKNTSEKAGGLAYNDGIIYLTTGMGDVYAIEEYDDDEKEAQIKWKKNIGMPIRSAPTIYDNNLYFSTINNQIFALNKQTGEKVWVNESAPQKAGLLGRPSPAADEETIIAPLNSGELTALRADSGDPLWSVILSDSSNIGSLGEINDIKGRAVIYNKTVYAVGYGNITAAIDLTNGRTLWEKEIGGTNQPWFAGKYLFMLTNNHEILALKAESGDIIWVNKLPKYKDAEDKKGLIWWSGPALISDRLIVGGSNGELLAISPYTGEILGKEDISESISLPPIIAQGKMIILTDEGNLYAYK